MSELTEENFNFSYTPITVPVYFNGKTVPAMRNVNGKREISNTPLQIVIADLGLGYEPLDDNEKDALDIHIKETLQAQGKYIPELDTLEYYYTDDGVVVIKNGGLTNTANKIQLRNRRLNMFHELPNAVHVMKQKLRLGRVAEAKGLPENIERHIKGFVDPAYPMGKHGYTYANLKKKRPEAVALMGKGSRKQRKTRKNRKNKKTRKNTK